ncbi:alpha/beta fold hydrolase [Parafrigoribacterium humi]|jgi:pimeloyl-ACP methyl ester carboxylesterase|uniref:alpha/beta fold hydrolase n=1 Tax=Parafrigoribacterium humi TaxID=3144664 RepID=UPI0032ECA2A4
MTDQTFTLSSGRRMGVSTLGDPFANRLVVLCHPMPGASGFDPNPLVTRNSGVRVVTFERPGYGSSDPLSENESRLVQARADDIAEYLTSDGTQTENAQALDIGVVGWGFGGAIALSLAARHPSLITRAAVVGLAVRALQSAQDEPLPDVEGDSAEPGPPTFDRASLGIDPTDPMFDLSGLGLRLDHMLAQAAIQGTVGVEIDSAAAQDLSWADELGRVNAPTVLIYGDAGGTLGAAAGRWLRKRVPNSRLVRVRGVGTLAIVSVWQKILDHATGN